jgi:hypothetical protein
MHMNHVRSLTSAAGITDGLDASGMPSPAIERRLLADEKIRLGQARAAAQAAIVRLRTEGVPGPLGSTAPAQAPIGPTAEDTAASLLSTAGAVSTALAAIAADLRGLTTSAVSGSSSDTSAEINKARAAACVVLRNAKRSLETSEDGHQAGEPPPSARRKEATSPRHSPGIPVSLERTLGVMNSNPAATLHSLCALVLTNWEHDFDSLQFVARTLWHMTRDRPGQPGGSGEHPGAAPAPALPPVGLPPAQVDSRAGRPASPIETASPRPTVAPAPGLRRPRRTGWHGGDPSVACQGFSPAPAPHRSRSTGRTRAERLQVPDSDVEEPYEDAS